MFKSLFPLNNIKLNKEYFINKLRKFKIYK